MTAAAPAALRRVFFALWPDDAVRAQLVWWREQLVFPASARVRAMRTANLHITLEFLGGLDAVQVRAAEAAADQVSARITGAAIGTVAGPLAGMDMGQAEIVQRAGGQATETAATDVGPFELVLDHYNHFPRARVLFAAAHEVPLRARRLQTELRQALAAAGLRVDQRPWAPHVTLFRKVRRPPPLPTPPPLHWPVREFCLVESVAAEGGVVYHVVRRWPLAPAAGDAVARGV